MKNLFNIKYDSYSPEYWIFLGLKVCAILGLSALVLTLFICVL